MRNDKQVSPVINLLLIINCCLSFAAVVERQPPNIIIFLADDLGWDDIGFHGSSQIRTPNIDSLAADGIILNNFYASPVCTPSRGALLTGIHPIHSGTQNYVILTPAPWGLPLNLKLMPQYLKEFNNYATHLVGKWHLGFYKKLYTPLFRGFDSHVGFYTGAGDYYDHTALEDKMFWGLDFRDNLRPIRNATGIYSTHYFTERSLKLISQHNTSQPLFLYVAYQSVHGANHYARLQAPTEYVDKFPGIQNKDRRTFAGMALAMDESIGAIVEAMHKRDMLNNSIIIFCSDNGGPASGFTGNAASNWPLRGVKATLWEGGIRVPALIWSPLLKQSRYVSNAMMHVSDFLPTLLDAIGARNSAYFTSPSSPTYGISMWPTLSDKKPSPRTEMLHNIDPIWNVSAIRVKESEDKDWKLIQGLVFPHWDGWYPPLSQEDDDPNECLSHCPMTSELSKSRVHRILRQLGRKPNYNVLKRSVVNCGTKPANASINCRPNIQPCLYNIARDPCEYYNVASDYPEIVKKLWRRILYFNSTAVPPLTVPNDPKADPKLHDYAWTFWADDDQVDDDDADQRDNVYADDWKEDDNEI